KKVQFLFAVHCDITVRYMTLVMSPNRSIYPFTPEWPRDLSAQAPEPAPQESLSYDVPTDLPLLKTSQDEVHISEYILNTKPQSKELCVLSALYGLVSYLGSLTLTSSGRYEILWLNFILKVVAAILTAWLAKFLTSLLAC